LQAGAAEVQYYYSRVSLTSRLEQCMRFVLPVLSECGKPRLGIKCTRYRLRGEAITMQHYDSNHGHSHQFTVVRCFLSSRGSGKSIGARSRCARTFCNSSLQELSHYLVKRHRPEYSFTQDRFFRKIEPSQAVLTGSLCSESTRQALGPGMAVAESHRINNLDLHLTSNRLVHSLYCGHRQH
jgi:hypothetical protein